MFDLGEKWWNFFQSITKSGKYGYFKISGALYKSYFFLLYYSLDIFGLVIDYE